ncbi:MAG: peptidoglycan-binding protein [Spirochaetaceae bacterium]|nr:peptidoglycan-binding protein [Spirochaetaceae bacterium]
MKPLMRIEEKALDKVYEALGEGPLPLRYQIYLAVHRLYCRRCDTELKQLAALGELLETGFFPEAPALEDPIMERIYREEAARSNLERDLSAGFSFRGWVIGGLIILVTLPTSFFGMGAASLRAVSGSSLLLPLGLTIGGIVTSYGALFIGSHLKELSQRFRPH